MNMVRIYGLDAGRALPAAAQTELDDRYPLKTGVVSSVGGLNGAVTVEQLQGLGIGGGETTHVPLSSEASPSERIARFLDFNGGFLRGAVAGDSTVNDGNDPMRKVLIRLGQLTPTGVGMKERMWNNTTSVYSDVTVKEGTTTASVGGTALTDNFNRTAAELVGSTTSGGQVWAGGAGSWSANGSVATANGGGALGFNTGTKSMTTTASLNVVTAATAASSQARVTVGATQANFSTGGSYVWAQLVVLASGETRVSLWKRISGVNTNLAAEVPITGLTTASSTPQVVDLELDIAIQAVTLTLTVGGVDQVITASVTEGDTGILGTFSGIALPANATGAMTFDSVTMATPYTPGVYTGLEVWNGAVGGTTLSHQQGLLSTLYPTATKFDFLFVTGGHNHGSEDPDTFIGKVSGFVDAFQAAHPETRIVVSSQNPQFAPATTITAHARRQAALRDYAMVNGFEYLPVFEAFTNQPDGGASLVNTTDGIHPTVTTTNDLNWSGNALWASVWLRSILARRQVSGVPAITEVP